VYNMNISGIASPYPLLQNTTKMRDANPKFKKLVQGSGFLP
jgi:hypothetical protein